MVVKTFTAPTMQEALLQAREALGDNAVVLNTRQVKAGGLFGFRRESNIEVMAAVDQPLEKAGKPPIETPSPPAAVVTKAYAGGALGYGETELARLRSDIRELRGLVTALVNQASSRSPEYVPLLLRLGVDPQIARKELSDLIGIDDADALTDLLAEKLTGKACPGWFGISRPGRSETEQRRVMALVGPTGVGKTTTLAKLAARFSVQQGKRVGLVTVDTYRIGAVDQLRTYATIMGLPLEVAMSPEDVGAALEKHADKDVVLIDTVGRSQRSPEHIGEVREFLAEAGEIEVHLVVAASVSREVQREVLDRFAMLVPARLIITKIDEAPDRGCIVNLPHWAGIGISCVTAGQNVPQDIDFADPAKLARLVTEVA